MCGENVPIELTATVGVTDAARLGNEVNAAFGD